MQELKTYLELSESVKNDRALMDLIETYEKESAELVRLIQNENYDAHEAIRLTNDVEFLSQTISQHPLYIQFLEAKSRLEKALRNKAAMTMTCDCNCSTCASKCDQNENKE